MSNYNFKHQKLFDFKPHPFDVGNPFGKWQGYEDNHFIRKLLKLNRGDFSAYYRHHCDDYVSIEKGTGEQFFKIVWSLVQNWIDILQRKDPIGRDHPNDVIKINKLNAFHEFLVSIDKWNARPADVVNAEMEKTIVTQREHINKLEDRLAALNEFETAQKVWIEEGYLPTFIHLFLQMRNLTVKGSRKLLKSDHKSPYYKMIGKYFSDGGSPVKTETVKNYFSPEAGTGQMKTEVPPEKQLFKIVPNDTHLKPGKKD
jgi:hypothetical protein